MTIAEHIPRDKHIPMDFHSCSDVMQILQPPELVFQWTVMYSGIEPNAKFILHSQNHAQEPEGCPIWHRNILFGGTYGLHPHGQTVNQAIS
jgi:hypothetical protein